MEKQPETPNKVVTTAEPVVKSSAGSADKTPVFGAGKMLWLATIAIALAAAAGSAWLWQVDQKMLQSLQAAQANIAGSIQRVDAQASDNRELQRQFDRQTLNAQQQLQQLQEKNSLLQRQLDSQQKRIQSLSTTDRADWLLAEAEYLMRLANQRLLMGKDVKGALVLLKAADDIMLELDDSALFPVREMLAADMAALRTADRVDMEGNYLQLAATAKQADQLRLIDMPQLALAEPEQQPAQDWQQRLEFGLQAAGNKLGQYIQITRRDEIYQPLLAPEYEAAVRQNVQLMFEQAQTASLSGRQHLYEDSLAKAKKWLNNYYTLDMQSTQAVIAMIDELSAQQVAVSLPDISSSLRALKHYVESIHEATPRTKKPAASSGEPIQ